jgi:tellurite resistance protein TehA-like permease
MDQNAIFGVQFLLSLIVYALIAKWYVTPWLAGKPVKQALIPLIVPHAFRLIGLLFLVPGVVAEPLPPEFADPAAYGDLASGLLAILALIALRGGWKAALSLVWLFNVVGTVDLLYAVFGGFSVSAQENMGAAWYIPTFIVPALLVTHFMVFARLLRAR